MQKIVNIPILNLPLETLQFAQEKGYSKVGLLSTQLTVKKRLFESKDDSVDIITPNLEEQAKITTVIMNVLSGVKPDQDKLILKKVIQRMEGQGAQAVILGCTELPLLLKEPDSSLDLLNTTKILAQAAVRECRQNIYKPKIFRGT
jgi:aspartate racemase